MDSIIDKKYIHVPNFLTKEELNILQPWCKAKALGDYTHDQQSPLAPSFYKDLIINSLLESKKEKMEEVSKLKLHSTYSFWRAYIHGSILKDHKDRPACEISVTVNIDSCGSKWPIHMDGTWLDMEIGDAVMYLGCEVNHGRKPFQGWYCAQAFLHYVNADGPYAVLRGDQGNKR
jgi:hypothetical protein